MLIFGNVWIADVAPVLDVALGATTWEVKMLGGHGRAWRSGKGF